MSSEPAAPRKAPAALGAILLAALWAWAGGPTSAAPDEAGGDASAPAATGAAPAPAESAAAAPTQEGSRQQGAAAVPASAGDGAEEGDGGATGDGAAPARAADPERPLGVEDLIEISVFEIPELNRTVRVSERGTLSLPLLGEVEAAGFSPRALEGRLRELLARRYLRDPQVSIFVREHGSKKVSVLGAVGKPGVYEMLGPRTLLQVLAQAGGLTQEAGADLHVIRRRPDGDEETISIPVNDLLVSRNPALNIAVQPWDVISAPLDRPVYIYIDGAVKTPGRIEQLASRPITLLQAIAKAGGATERANLRAIQILRQSPDGTQTIVEANVKKIRKGREPDPILGEGDVVVVPETFF
jgi:polysaccharide export outer membrane protein